VGAESCCGALGQYVYDAYANIDDDVVTAKTQIDEEIVREMKSKYGKEEELEEEEKLSCQFPL
jgi:hypothetical protein